MSGELLDTKGCAERLKISTRTLARWRKRNYGPPAIDTPGKWLYDAEAIDRWLDSVTVELGSKWSSEEENR